VQCDSSVMSSPFAFLAIAEWASRRAACRIGRAETCRRGVFRHDGAAARRCPRPTVIPGSTTACGRSTPIFDDERMRLRGHLHPPRRKPDASSRVEYGAGPMATLRPRRCRLLAEVQPVRTDRAVATCRRPSGGAHCQRTIVPAVTNPRGVASSARPNTALPRVRTAR